MSLRGDRNELALTLLILTVVNELRYETQAVKVLNWRASVYGTRNGHQAYGDALRDGGDESDANGLDYGTTEIIPDATVHRLAGSMYFRAQEVAQSGRMQDLVCETTGQNAKLSGMILSGGGLDGSHRAWVTVEESTSRILSSHCDCPGFGRYGAICKHIIALILHYNNSSFAFQHIGETKREIVHTSRVLSAFMTQQEAQAREEAKTRQLELLKKVDTLADAGSGQTSHLARGSVSLRLGIDCTTNVWIITLRIGTHDAAYNVKNIESFIAAVRAKQFVAYGKKLGFIHTFESFDEHSQSIINILDRAMQIRQTVSGGHSQFRQRTPNNNPEELLLSDDEISELLDQFVGSRASLDYSPPRQFFSPTMPALVSDGDPDLGLRITRTPSHPEDESHAGDTSHLENAAHAENSANAELVMDALNKTAVAQAEYSDGVYIQRKLCVERFIKGHRACFVIVRPCDGFELEGTHYPRIYRCSPEFYANRKLIAMLCNSDENEDLFVEEKDIIVFSRTVLPLMCIAPEVRGHESRLVADIDQDLLAMRRVPCRIETFLDRDEQGITCEIKARYGDEQFTIFGGPRGASVPKSGFRIIREPETERLAVEAALHYFVKPLGQLARIPESNDAAIYKLLTEGLPVLRDLGDVFCTQAFDGISAIARPTVSLGLSMKSGLVEISTIADEINADEVAELLQSYRKNKRYHRLRNGTFVDVPGLRIEGIADIAADLHMKEQDLEQGSVTVPAYAAYYLDQQIDDAHKDTSFKTYMEHIESHETSAHSVPEPLAKMLRPYQKQGFHWLDKVSEKGFGGILADEMGLGKTVQLLSLLAARRDEQRKIGPNLIVCPASLVYNWAAECARFTPELNVAAVAGNKASRREILESAANKKKRPDLLITSYDLLRRDIADYKDIEFYCMALDEAQYIKNHATQSAKAVRSITAHHKFALTGTPIENKLSELWSIFDFLMPSILGSYRHFRDRFELPILSGDTDVESRLQSIVHPFILRRLKSQVLKDLPDKIENVLTVQLEGAQRKLYAALEQQLRASINKDHELDVATGKIQILAQLTRLREACCDPRLLSADADVSANAGGSAKIEAIADLVTSCQDFGKKMLIFSQFTSFLDLIAERLRADGVAYDVITGSTPKQRRIELVNQFNNDDTPVFLISLKAGNTGLNLTGASVVVHADPWWNAAAQNQATDRAHRIGQTKNVNVYQIVAKDTIEERILNLQNSKTDLASRFVGAASQTGGSIASLNTQDVLALLG